jgi:hypothetical protein
VPTDAAGEAATLGHAAHVDLLTGFEQRDIDLCRRPRDPRPLRRLEPKLAQALARLDAGLGEMTGHGLAHPRCAAATRRELDGAVAVAVSSLRTWVTRLGATSMTVTGTLAPSS